MLKDGDTSLGSNKIKTLKGGLLKKKKGRVERTLMGGSIKKKTGRVERTLKGGSKKKKRQGGI